VPCGGRKPVEQFPSPSPSLTANPQLREWLDLSVHGVVTIRPGKSSTARECGRRWPRSRPRSSTSGWTRSGGRGEHAGSPDEGVTSGSRSIQDCGGALRQVCAQVRAAFLAGAAEKLGTDAAGLTVRRGSASTGSASTGSAGTGNQPGRAELLVAG